MYEPKATGVTSIVILEFISFVLLTTSPLFLLFYYIAYEYYGASITSSVAALLSKGPTEFFPLYLPSVTILSGVVYICWVIFQAALYVLLPGRMHHGPRTCGGRQLPYKLNGLLAWFITVAAAALLSYYNIIDPSFIARHWGALLVTASVYSLALIVIFKIKAHIKPDNRGETLFTGHFWYDTFNGGELHPRTGKLFDWKHFNASRTGGLLLWTLIDLSFAVLQYQLIGKTTNSMVLAVAFRAIIVIEYFYYENWFFETLDGSHERFSFYNIYGFAAMMPHIWTLQTQYLAIHPVELSTPRSIFIVFMFTAGWALNHVANDQKSTSRRTEGKCQIWGQDARFIEATYETTDGKKHNTLLLYSGWWGVVRHANYVGSCLYTWASCMPCGSNHLFPYTEAIIMTLMCIHRCLRDEARCKVKYGAAWDEYCRRVRWRMIPGFF